MSALFETLVPALLHTLWIGVAVAILLAGVLRCLPASRPNLRYALSLAALAAIVLGGIISWAALQPRAAEEPIGAPERSETRSTGDTPRPSETFPLQKRVAVTAAADLQNGHPFPWQPVLGTFWLLGFAAMLLRYFTSLGGAFRLRKAAVEMPADAPILEAFQRLCARIEIPGRTVLRLSEEIAAPAVIGFLRPVVLWPTSWLTGLTPGQVEAVLAHELAHLQRHDYVVNLVQLLIEAALFFNPAVWWISHRIRVEREACCDAAAVQITGAPRAVAAALARVAETSVLPAPALAMAGDGGVSGLAERIRRLLDPGARAKIRLPWPILVGALAVSLVVVRLLGTGAEWAVAKLNGPAHVAEVQAIEREYDSDVFEKRSGEERQRVTIRGILTTHDGAPIPENTFVQIDTNRPGYSGRNGARVGADGRFVAKGVQPGAITASASVEGYAPAVFGPVSSDGIGEVLLELGEGFPMSVMVESEAGSPLSDVEVEISLDVVAARVATWTRRSDADGRFVLPNLIEGKLAARVVVPGYEMTYQEGTAKVDGTFRVGLREAKPVRGAIFDAATGEPISGAHIRLMSGPSRFSNDDPRRDYTRKEAPKAISGADGSFLIDTLQTGIDHSIWIEGAGYRPEILHSVQAGETDLVIRLGPPIQIRVELDEAFSGETLEVSQILQLSPNHNSGFSAKMPVVREPGETFAVIEGPFLVAGPLKVLSSGPPVQIQSPDAITTFSLEPSPDRDESFVPPTRLVRLELTAPEGWPIPEGEVRLGFVQIEADGSRLIEADFVTIEKGSAQMEVPLTDGKGELWCEDLRAPGFWMEDQRNVEVLAGEGPQIVTVQAHPAGVIYGLVVDPRGNPVPGAHLAMKAIEPPEDQPRPDPNWWHNNPADQEGRFMLSPVPLGGRYRPECSHPTTSARFFSELVEVDRKNPRREITLVLPDGEDLFVNVLDPEGNPAPNAEVSLDYSAENGGLDDSPQMADRDGKLVFRGVNFDLPVAYYLEVEPRADFAAMRVKVDPSARAVSIQLKKGERLEGRVVDATSGVPLAHRVVWARGDYAMATYPDTFETHTDREGYFIFKNLERVKYTISTVGNVRTEVTLPRPPDAPPIELRVE